MIIKPERIVFEDKRDVIDYVSRGMVPTRKNFERVMYKVRCPDDEKSDDFYIPSRLFIDCDTDTMNEALQRVYENRVRNRNIALAITGVVVAGIIIGGVRSKNNSANSTDDDIEIVEF